MTTIRKTAVRLSWKVVPFKRLIKPTVHKVLSSRLMPGCWMRAFRLLRILAFDYGHLKSSAIMRSIDAAGKPLPWITYPAIAFLLQLDLSDKKVFEYGCGASTIFWSGLAKHVDSVEDNEAFCREIWPALPPNCHLSLEPFPEEYIHAVVRGAPYDIIVIDGHSRVRCSEVAAKYLKPGGFIILDNSDWFHQASANLRNADLIEVDMAGMAPISDFVSTTSFYFHREFRGEPKADRQPVGAIGSIPKPNFPKVTGPSPQAAPRSADAA
jgi:hypothetical protein